jgi:hypothetical protein
MDWHSFASAGLAIRGVEREFGLDSILESQYGIDGGATWAVDWAYAEGGWDQFHALTSLAYTGLAIDSIGPDWSNLVRTFQESDVWLNGSGPMSSADPTFVGWAETPIKAAWSCEGEDMSITYPWYGEFGNRFLPRLPTEKKPSPLVWIELPTKCDFIKYTGAVAGIAVGIMSESELKRKFPLWYAAAKAIALTMGTAALIYGCR